MNGRGHASLAITPLCTFWHSRSYYQLVMNMHIATEFCMPLMWCSSEHIMPVVPACLRAQQLNGMSVSSPSPAGSAVLSKRSDAGACTCVRTVGSHKEPIGSCPPCIHLSHQNTKMAISPPIVLHTDRQISKAR